MLGKQRPSLLLMLEAPSAKSRLFAQEDNKAVHHIKFCVTRRLLVVGYACGKVCHYEFDVVSRNIDVKVYIDSEQTFFHAEPMP